MIIIDSVHYRLLCSLPCKLFDNFTAVLLSSVVLVCITVVVPLNVVDSVIVEISVETINVK